MGPPFLVLSGGVDFLLFGDRDSGSGTMVKETAISWFIPEKNQPKMKYRFRECNRVDRDQPERKRSMEPQSSNVNR